MYWIKWKNGRRWDSQKVEHDGLKRNLDFILSAAGSQWRLLSKGVSDIIQPLDIFQSSVVDVGPPGLDGANMESERKGFFCSKNLYGIQMAIQLYIKTSGSSKIVPKLFFQLISHQHPKLQPKWNLSWFFPSLNPCHFLCNPLLDFIISFLVSVVHV